MPYEHIPHVGATYLDGSFPATQPSSQDEVLVLGAAKSGESYELFNVGEIGQAEAEFGADAEIMQGIHEAFAQGADNIRCMRIGGREGIAQVEDSDGDTLTIRTIYRDADALDRYSLVMTVTGTKQRILIYDLDDESWVYDSDEEKVLNTGIVYVDDSGLDLFTCGDITAPEDSTATPVLSALASSDFTQQGTATIALVTTIAGDDGTSMSQVERYAALDTAYSLLDFRDADLIVPKGVYIDSPNVVDSGATAKLGLLPDKDDPEDELGYLWQYEYRGKVYTYFTDSSSYFSDGSKVAASMSFDSSLVVGALEADARNTGTNGNDITLSVVDGTDVGVSLDMTDSALAITVTVDISGGSPQWTDVQALIEASEADRWITVTNADASAAEAFSDEAFTGGTGPNRLTHRQLTGDAVPSAVDTRWTTAESNDADAELRECNFAHQLATWCEKASRTWSNMLGFISTTGPAGFSRSKVADWIGSLPTYSSAGDDDIVDSSGDDGDGLLGIKFLAGEAGYRNAEVEDGDASDGLAYGGIIRTTGSSLPNGSDRPYGIDDSDEAVDANGWPADIGKFIVVTGEWLIHRNSYNGGTQYRGPISGSLAGLIATLPANQEPIGNIGVLRKVSSPTRKHASQENDLSQIRISTVTLDDDLGNKIVNIKTAAHPDSDYSRVSTIRTVNSHMDAIRRIGRRYTGKSFSSTNTMSLKSAIDRYLQDRKRNGFNGGFDVRIKFSRAEKILGQLNIVVKLVPPFSIETITVQMSLAADESDL